MLIIFPISVVEKNVPNMKSLGVRIPGIGHEETEPLQALSRMGTMQLIF